MELELWYHGSPSATIILDQGFNLHHQRRNDPGDFGWGIYVVKNISRARCYGTILGVMIDIENCAYISNPYFLNKLSVMPPITFEEQLFYNMAFGEDGRMLTIKGPKNERETVSKEIREVFLQKGYTGILTDYSKGEMVIFDPTIIQDVFLTK
jgi:hypothetical protein